MTFQLPLKDIALTMPPVTQWFAANKEKYKALFGLDGHGGIDIATFYGDEILACTRGPVVAIYDESDHQMARGNGVVQLSEPFLYQGKSVVVKITYWHMKEVNERLLGKVVEAGQVLGTEGNSGAVFSLGVYVPLDQRDTPPYKGTHLHWETHLLEVLPEDVSPWGYPSDLIYLEQRYRVLDYDNGLHGAVDPRYIINFLSSTMTIKKQRGTEDVWAIGLDGKRHQIINTETFERGKFMGLWGDWSEVALVDSLTEPEGNAIIIVKSQ